MSDLKTMTAPPACYAVTYPVLAEIARRHGYALAVHGTMKRDFDLIAVPWVDDAGDPFSMVEEMKAALGGVYSHHEFDHLIKDGSRSTKPHGRNAWSIHLTNRGSDGPYIDLSVMQRAQPQAGDTLEPIRQAVRDYHYSLDTRLHGGVAADTVIKAIETVLGMPWQQGQEAGRRASVAQEGGAT